MRSLAVTAVVTPDHTLTVAVPADIAPGPHRVVVLIQDDVPPPPQGRPDFFAWPAHAAAPADPSCTCRRANLYGDDGR
jgi:hypothetical protein